MEGEGACSKPVRIKNWGEIVQNWQFCEKQQLLSLEEDGTAP